MFLDLFVSNLLTIPIFVFVLGMLLSRCSIHFSSKLSSLLTFFLLFGIGFKGGISFIEHSGYHLILILGVLILWGLLQPFLSYGILRKFTQIDKATAVAIAACFGSISVMTYAAGSTFLEKLQVEYDGLVVAALAVMEIPAIISGLYIAKLFQPVHEQKHILKEVVLNKTVLMIFSGMVVGMIVTYMKWSGVSIIILTLFKPFLYLFLFSMGLLVGRHRGELREFSWSLSLFGVYMPLIGGAFGIALSYALGLNPGTGMLIALLTASASYIAVPAAIKVALPEAKEAIYLPLSLGITFPFNVMVGIPMYYQLALKFLR